jgi:DNA-binding transcriptional ArsR family regulator
MSFIALIYNQMVVWESLSTTDADRVFHALADSTRRDILVRTLEGAHSVSALAGLYPMSFAAVQKHVAVLEEARLIGKERRGRERLVSGRPETLREVARLLDRFEEQWVGRIGRMSALLDEEEGG